MKWQSLRRWLRGAVVLIPLLLWGEARANTPERDSVPRVNADTADAWDWIYEWRMAHRPAPGTPSAFDPTQPQFWPVERVVGGAAQPLPRRKGGCLTAERLVEALAEVRRTGSYSFLVWRQGAVEIEYFGTGFGPETRPEPASMHKSVLALVVGQAVADGAVPDLDAPVSRWLEEWAQDPRGAITVRQMLQMSTGLAPLPFSMAPGSAYSRALYGGEGAAVPLAAPLVDAPGRRFNYASGISQLLGLIIERATGERYADYLSRRLWQPLGAADAFVALDHPGGLARTSSGLFATSEDWLRLGVLFVQKGKVQGRQVVDAAWLTRMTSPAPTNPNYGFQIWRGSPHAPKRHYNNVTPTAMPAVAPFLAEDMVFFDGAGAQRVYVSPEEGLVIVRLGAPALDWDDSRLPNLVVRAARACPL
ncbi:serine hydrolase [Roseateles sp. SL47]|uniref:serine hydrolase domain-containing protein n=1 Tax=Roseateles sp. SL47 TaxID=2995138 RepID=UPI00226EE017|nr:serine hydrolase [Roseateles sp. SL47]WAC71955.1 serine hydrolase [Roseateles sp. SL47]